MTNTDTGEINKMILNVIIDGLILGLLLIFVCATAKRRGLSVMNLVDRFAVDEWWVGHTRAWTIHGTEDLKPYITARDRCVKWIFGTLGMAVISAALAGIMTLFIR